MPAPDSKYFEKNTINRDDPPSVQKGTRNELKSLSKELKAQWQVEKELFGQENTVNFWETFNYKNWGLTDYSEYSSFNSAFRNARENGENEFFYKEKRYNTNLISKEHSDLYHESKKFLEDYYSQVIPDFKELQYGDFSWNKYMKETTGTNWLEYYDSLSADSENLEKMMAAQNKLDELSDNYYDPKKNKTFFKYNTDENYQKWAIEKYRNLFLKNLNNNSMYFSITNYKPDDMEEEGHVINNKKIFINIPKNQKEIETTPVHELTHKTQDFSQIYNNIPSIDVKKINKNRSLFNWSQEYFDYITRPDEIHARKMSTLFYLYKKGKNYRNLSMKDLNSLYMAKDLPPDVNQLLTLFQLQKNELLDYLNNNEN
jgi:hypothetical protein